MNVITTNITKRCAHKKNGLLKELSINWPAYIMALPGIIFILMFHYLPLIGNVLAFKDYNAVDGIFGSPWAGLKHFSFFFSNISKVWSVTFNTIYLNTLFIVTGLIFQISFAILLNEITNKFIKRISQSIMFLPYFLSWIVVSAIIYAMFCTKGSVNNALAILGVERLQWYMKGEYWRTILTGAHVWRNTGYGIIIYLASITTFDKSNFEASIIDGANHIQQIWYITLPLLKPTAVILTLLAIGRIFYGDFGMVYAIVKDNGLLLPKTEVIDTFVYRSMRKTGEIAYSSAVGLYQAFLGFIMVTLSNHIAKKTGDGTSLF